ncbi:MAG: phosphotransferase [Kiritimatiellia bacterium]
MNKTADFFQHPIFQDEHCRFSGRMAVVSRHGVPLLLLPRDKDIALKTIQLYLPQTRVGRLSVWVLRLLVRMHLLWLLPQISGSSAFTDEGASGYLVCNPVHGVRLIRVAKDQDGFLIEKIAERSNAAPVESEYRMLQRVQNTKHVPAVSEWKETESLVAFRMPYYGQAPAMIDVCQILGLWKSREEMCAEDSSFLQKLRPHLPDGFWRQISKKRFRKALVHGDFVPWNIRTAATNELVCIDWEYAEEDGIAGFDFAYFILQQALCVFHCSIENLAGVLTEVLRPDSNLHRRYHLAIPEGGGGRIQCLWADGRRGRTACVGVSGVPGYAISRLFRFCTRGVFDR